jgi:hypothetical protein
MESHLAWMIAMRIVLWTIFHRIHPDITIFQYFLDQDGKKDIPVRKGKT